MFAEFIQGVLWSRYDYVIGRAAIGEYQVTLGIALCKVSLEG